MRDVGAPTPTAMWFLIDSAIAMYDLLRENLRNVGTERWVPGRNTPYTLNTISHYDRVDNEEEYLHLFKMHF